MKVLQINSVCGVGSTGRIATDIHKVLTAQGHTSYVAFGRDKPLNCDEAIRIGSPADYYLHALLTRLSDRHGFGSRTATTHFLKKIECLAPDIIHLHNIHGYYINIQLLFQYLKQTSVPVVWTLHDCWAFTGHCSYFDYVNCDKWKNICHHCPQKKSYPSSLLLDNSRHNYLKKKALFAGIKNMTLVTPSSWLGNLTSESYLKEYALKVINNGIDLNTFRPIESDFRKRHGLEGQFVILGVASNWGLRKGLQYFLQLSETLQQDERIVLVGLSEGQLRGLPKNIIGIIRTNSAKELAEIYSSVDVFVNPTLEDNFPTTNLESLACGTPVITFDTGGSIECVDKDTGFVVEKGNLDKLVYIIRMFRLDFTRHTQMRKNCVARARQLYDKNERYKDYITIYQNALHMN